MLTYVYSRAGLESVVKKTGVLVATAWQNCTMTAN